MGQTGEFKEYQNTGSYNAVYELTNPPPVSSVVMRSGSLYTGQWQQLNVVSASQFVILSGSISGDVTSSLWPAGTSFVGFFTAVKLNSGIVYALNGKANI